MGKSNVLLGRQGSGDAASRLLGPLQVMVVRRQGGPGVNFTFKVALKAMVYRTCTAKMLVDFCLGCDERLSQLCNNDVVPLILIDLV